MNVEVFFNKLETLETAGEINFPAEMKAELWAVAKDMKDKDVEETIVAALAPYFEFANFKVMAREFLGKPPDWEPKDDA